MKYLLSAKDRYRGRGYDREQEAEQKQVKIMKDRRDKVRPEYHVLKLQSEGPLSKPVFKAYEKTLDIAGVGDVVLKTSFGTSWTLKDVRYILGLKRRLISVGQLDEESNHAGFEDQQWKVTKDIRKGDLHFYKPGGLGKQKNLSFTTSVKTRKLQRSCGRYNVNLQVKCLTFDNGGEYSS
nr:retrovirus-related Pol polyprotein from transposon TNT 1-94 [Tanacetum cinerariifolium]